MISTRRILAGALAAAAVTLAVSTPALADGWKHGHGWGPPWRHHDGYYDRGYYDRRPDVVVVQPRPRYYYERPRVYYERPPVYVERPPVYVERPPAYYEPPPVYVAPSPGISVNIPLRFD
ncbi:hypothetical protein AB4Z01_22465 [Inquilinus sp. YAF38]|uniref:hypothetical protein n=1 Tax=Inquilinus sp. YAF38 TaxID=3233084 RepID=UPI003F929FC0